MQGSVCNKLIVSGSIFKHSLIIAAMENGDIQENWWSAPASPIERLHKFSKNAVKRASDSWHGSNPGSPNTSTLNLEQEEGHRRSVSSGTFQKWKSQVHKALYWRSRSFCREDRQYPSFDPEVLADQKRQWYKIQSKALDPDKFKEPASLFEHFTIVGLRPDTNLEVIEDAFFKRKRLEQEMSGNDQISDSNTGRYSHEPTCSTLEPQVLFKYPAGTKLALRLKDLASFCFPGGVKAGVLKRTPSVSELNELLYGQGHLYSEESSFIFSVKVADSATLYGVCLHVQEFVQEPPVMPGVSSPVSQSQSVRRCRYLISAPRCYCILTRVPFFELHFEILNSIVAQKHLNRISQFVNDTHLSDYVPSSPSMSRNHHTNGNADSLGGESGVDWASTATPADSVLTVAAATAAGIEPDDEVATPNWEICSPGVSASDLIDHSQFDKDGGKIISMHAIDQCSEISFSSAISMVSDEDTDEIFYNHGSDDITVESARENKNDLVQIISSYHSMHVPPRGREILFQPLEHLEPIVYHRPPVSNLGFSENYLERILEDSRGVSQVNIKLAGAEEALALSLWSTATICRVLSLESVLALVTSVLLEKQVVVLCPNLGVLSAVVLSLIPIIRPFEWQSLFLPILPLKMLDFIDAPVPFIVGLMHKPDDLMMKAPHIVQVNVVKKQVKSRGLPQLPKYKELLSELKPIHAALSSVDYVSQRHSTKPAEQFLIVIRQYMESLCSGLRSHTITSVQSNNDRVSVLLKDSFIDSFPATDQHFVKLFVETQMFTVLSDSQLSCFDNEQC